MSQKQPLRLVVNHMDRRFGNVLILNCNIIQNRQTKGLYGLFV